VPCPQAYTDIPSFLPSFQYIRSRPLTMSFALFLCYQFLLQEKAPLIHKNSELHDTPPLRIVAPRNYVEEASFRFFPTFKGDHPLSRNKNISAHVLPNAGPRIASPSSYHILTVVLFKELFISSPPLSVFFFFFPVHRFLPILGEGGEPQSEI